MWSVEGGAWDIVYVKKKNTLAWVVCKLFAHRGRDAGVQQEGAVCAAERVNDAAMVLHSVYKARMFM